MGIVSGTISITRFRVLGNIEMSLKKINKNLQNYIGGDLLDTSHKAEQKASWVMPTGTIAGQDERDGDYWDMSDCELGEHYLLKLRIEKRKVPTEVLNQVAKKEINKLSDARGKRLSRPEQREVKDALKDELTGKVLPQVSHVDVVWKFLEKEIWLLSTAKSTKQIFADLFKKTFLKNSNATLMMIEPPLIGFEARQRAGEEDQMIDHLAALVPTTIAKPNEALHP